jgi:nitrile hydratase
MLAPHDVGGLRGFGSIQIEPNEPPHAAWEGSVLGMTIAAMARGLVSIDRWRARQEELHPLAYLEMPYFERWLYAVERNLVLEGVLAEGEIEARLQELAKDPSQPLPEHQDPQFDRTIETLIAAGEPIFQEAPEPPLYAVGDEVTLRVIPIERPGDQHTRLPGYAQGQAGVVARAHPAQGLPDAMVDRNELRPEHTYTIRLDATRIWADAEPDSSVHVDVWESYLEPRVTTEATG